MIFSDKKTQIDDLLDRMAAEVQLDDTRYDRMKGHYEAIKNWIEDDEKFFKPYKYDVYPHGSVRILTTVKPIGKDEFDLDIAIHLKAQWGNHIPERIYNELKRRLMEHEKYAKILEAKNRCIRINYHGDFHIDILPGIQEFEWDENRLKIPDRDLGRWVSSSPRGYANWFLGRNNMVVESLLEKALRAEKIPVDNFKHKKPLQRSVQLIKRFRDIYFQKDDTYRTSSIILTTIAGQFYNGEDSIFDTIDNIIKRIKTQILAQPQRLVILNPVNNQENFTDKWDEDPGYYKAFIAFCDYLDAAWQELKRDNGMLLESQVLKGLAGDDILIKAQKSQSDIIGSYRQQNNLGINRSTGVLGAAASSISSVKSNTFFGE